MADKGRERGGNEQSSGERAHKGDWVQIHRIILPAGQRAPAVPAETQAVPLEMRVKGFLDHDAALGEEVTVTTVIGRTLKGRLEAVNPPYTHSFGPIPPELVRVGMELRQRLEEAESASTAGQAGGRDGEVGDR